MKEATRQFAEEHMYEDTSKLLLSANRYPDIDMVAAVQQIEGKRDAKDKWPSLFSIMGYEYPPRINREQSSSEATARHKSAVATTLTKDLSDIHIADLTGGMGIDSIALAHIGNCFSCELHYIERDPELCMLMARNTETLGIKNITIHNEDCIQWIENKRSKLDIIYIDPARRDNNGRKVSAFENCSPNILENLSTLQTSSTWLMVKASPMIDLSLAEAQLQSVVQIHIVAVHGECKEVIFICGEKEAETEIYCTDLGHRTKTIRFTRSEESASSVIYCDGTMGKYIYEPNAAIMKGSPYKILSDIHNIAKLDRNTHLYTSDKLISEFPGRIFEIEKQISLNKKNIPNELPNRKANIISRNYPMTPEAIRKQTNIKEGGDKFIIATTVNHTCQTFLCNRIDIQ